MSSNRVSAIHDFSLEARDILEKEVSEQLEGIYGLLPDGKCAPAEKYPALEIFSEARETRKRLEQFLDDERAAGLDPGKAREKIVKEAAFTWLNRLVAFKMMETRIIGEDEGGDPEKNNESPRGRGRQKRFLTFEELCLASGSHPETVYAFIASKHLERSEEILGSLLGEKAWEALERGDYDWAFQAMDHWPDRVREKCNTNKSLL